MMFEAGDEKRFDLKLASFESFRFSQHEFAVHFVLYRNRMNDFPIRALRGGNILLACFNRLLNIERGNFKVGAGGDDGADRGNASKSDAANRSDGALDGKPGGFFRLRNGRADAFDRVPLA